MLWMMGPGDHIGYQALLHLLVSEYSLALYQNNFLSVVFGIVYLQCTSAEKSI